MLVIYDNLERIVGEYDRHTIEILFPQGTRISGTQDGELVIWHPIHKMHDVKAGIVILNSVKKIFATKGEKSWWPGEKFKHISKFRNIMTTTKDGRYIIKSNNGKRLWKMFDYGGE